MTRLTLEGMEIEVDALKGAIVKLENGQLTIRRDMSAATDDLSELSNRLNKLSDEVNGLTPRLQKNTDICETIQNDTKELLRVQAERMVVSKWFQNKFSSLRVIGLTIGAIAVGIGAVSGLFGWLIKHFLPI